MSYRYDVFISYRRHQEWTPWTREHIYTLLDAYLSQEMTERPRIFVDEKIEPGADWPYRLGDTLAHSRVLLPIFTGDYFNSDWCVHELDLMHMRLLRHHASQLIFPIVGHDGELIPDEIGRFQLVDLKRFRNTDLQRHTPRYEQFSDTIQALAPHLAAAIDTAPAFDPAWEPECRARFDEIYAAHCCGNRVPATTLTPKARPRPVTPPRVIL